MTPYKSLDIALFLLVLSIIIRFYLGRDYAINSYYSYYLIVIYFKLSIELNIFTIYNIDIDELIAKYYLSYGVSD